MADQDLIILTADIVSAHVANNNVAINDLPTLISSVHAALANRGRPVEPAPVAQEPAVPVRGSIKPDYLICLEDGAKVTMLKRYIRTRFDLTPDQYRAKWNLPADYPMVAPNYSARRSQLAHSIGLGRKRIEAPVEVVAGAVTKVATAGRRKLGIFAAKAAAAAHLTGDEG